MHLKQLQTFFAYEPHTEDPQVLVEDIVHQARRYLTSEQCEDIYTTYEYARQAHGTQKRLSGEEYIVHPLKATLFLMDMKPDLASIQACILHDVIEDTPLTYDDIHDTFSKEVAILCTGLVKVSTIKYRGEERQLETLKKTFLAMAHDLRVIFIKIVDRIHNIQTIAYHPNPEKRERIARETMMVYVPIAKRLGLYRYQLLLENGSFMCLEPKQCTKIIKYIEKNFGADRRHIQRGQSQIQKLMTEEGVPCIKIAGRVKSPYRVYEKIVNKPTINDPSQVMDIIAFRVITDTIGNCYNALGAIHHHHTPMIKKIKDYISLPKANGYQSLHTTILGMFRFPVEIQIRTQSMDDVAEYGVAAHFAYSDKNSDISASQAAWIKKLQDIVTTYQTIDDKEAFKNELNIEVLSKSVFLYTPKGDIFEMPKGSTVLDFAFRIHTDVGLSFKSAIVNGVIKPIGYQPASGDIINIKTYRNKKTATKYRSDFLHTTSAKNKLQKYIKIHEKSEILKRSITILNSRLDERNLPHIGTQDDGIRGRYSETEWEKRLIDMYNKQESYSAFIKESYPKDRARAHTKTSQTKPTPARPSIARVTIDHNHHITYRLCTTCSPTQQDKIIAKSGRNGMVIHSVSCAGVRTASIQSLLEAHRYGLPITRYHATLIIKVQNLSKNMSNILQSIADTSITIDHIAIDNTNTDVGKLTLVTSYTNPAKFDYLRHALKKYEDFRNVRIQSIE